MITDYAIYCEKNFFKWTLFYYNGIHIWRTRFGSKEKCIDYIFRCNRDTH